MDRGSEKDLVPGAYNALEDDLNYTAFFKMFFYNKGAPHKSSIVVICQRIKTNAFDGKQSIRVIGLWISVLDQ